MLNISSDLYLILGAPLVRGMAGWAQNAFEDGKVDLPEWKKLASTLLRIGIPALALYYGLDLDAEVAATLPFLADYFVSMVFKKAKKE